MAIRKRGSSESIFRESHGDSDIDAVTADSDLGVLEAGETASPDAFDIGRFIEEQWLAQPPVGRGSIRKLDGPICDFREPVCDSDLDAVAADLDVKVLQTDRPANPDSWRRINDRLLSRRPDIQIRVYGFYGVPCDLNFLPLLPNVRRLAVDSLWGEVTGLDFLAGLSAPLEHLSVGILELTDFSFLESIKPSLKSLSLEATKSKRPSLAPLSRFTQLETAYLEGQQKDIEVLSELVGLRDVTLRSISTPNLDYLRPLHNMWSLDLKLGGIRDLSALCGMGGIKYFEAWQVRGLSDLSALSELSGLQNLFLQSLPRVRVLPSLSNLRNLRRVELMNMKGLRDLAPLEFAPALEEFAFWEGNEPEDLAPVLRNPNLKRVDAGFGSWRKSGEFDELRSRAGIEEFAWPTEFRYT